MGQPLVHPLQDWLNYENYKFPEIELEKRFEGVEVRRDLEIELRPVEQTRVSKPILCGFEAVRE